eukprot:Pompholyxophrys_punicea_v1_NODE_736_length_1376_cov_2.553369.p1 type:complete len:202 gc:universal NODE_736_length_1376_cov_2.553369:797-192(-)
MGRFFFEIGCPPFAVDIAASVAKGALNPITHSQWDDQCPASLAHVINRDVNPSILTEEDIPGASLDGRPIGTLNVQQLKLWLSCRDLDHGGNLEELRGLVEIAKTQNLPIFDISGNGSFLQKKLDRLKSANAIDYDVFPLLEPFPRLPEDELWLDETKLVNFETAFVSINTNDVRTYLQNFVEFMSRTAKFSSIPRRQKFI